MARFLIRSLISTIVTMLLVSIALFLLLEVGTGDITIKILGVFSTEEQRASYRAQLGLNDPVWQSVSVGFNTFSVAEYRKPEFLVEAATDKTEYRAGETIEVSLEASFFSGGPVANAPVRWTLLSDNYYFDYQGEGYYDFTNEENIRSNDFNPNYGYGFGEQIGSAWSIGQEFKGFVFVFSGHVRLSWPAVLTYLQVILS